jgi:hypothetical protein
VEEKEALVRKLIDAKERLELLGYSLSGIKVHYDSLINDLERHSQAIDISFEQFAVAISSVETAKVHLIEDGDFDFGELAKTIVNDPEFNKVVHFSKYSKWDIGEFLENIDPYIILRLLVENPANHQESLVWRYQDIIDGGWAEPGKTHTALSEKQKFLVVTEGSSDSYILRRALDTLRPSIADFFTFIDMEENYPFTGSGNLYRFCQGLASIGIQNKVVVVFDNDTEGVEKYELTTRLKLPAQMKVMRLPDLAVLTEFKCIGPSGEAKENINGRAASIECFLDFKKVPKEPRVRWTAFNSRRGTYQGEIEKKDDYVSAFKKSNLAGDYDTAKMEALLSSLYSTCISIPGSVDIE